MQYPYNCSHTWICTNDLTALKIEDIIMQSFMQPASLSSSHEFFFLFLPITYTTFFIMKSVMFDVKSVIPDFIFDEFFILRKKCFSRLVDKFYCMSRCS